MSRSLEVLISWGIKVKKTLAGSSASRNPQSEKMARAMKEMIFNHST
jgi:hypothetical protein